MKLLHIGFPNPAMGRAFMRHTEYKFIDWTAWTAIPNNVPNLHKHITEVCDDFNPDIVFMQIQSPGVITPEFVQTLPGHVINWTWDYRVPTPEWMVDLAPYVTSAFTNETDVDYLKSLGHRAVFLQGGFDNDVYDPDGAINSNADMVEIVFMANNYPEDEYDFPLMQYRRDMVSMLKERYGPRFAVYGFGWPGQNPLQSFMHREEKEAIAYRSSKVAINLSHFEANRYTSDRMFRLLGSGTMCLSHDFPGLDKDFVDGVQLRVWSNLEELVELIDYYISDDNCMERVHISESGCKLAHMNYTWSNMVGHIMELELTEKNTAC